MTMGVNGTVSESEAVRLVPPEPPLCRSAFSRFATGVCVGATMTSEGPHAATLNAFSAISLEPPLLSICLQRGSRMAAAITEAGRFAITVLAAQQSSVAIHLANPRRRRGADALDGVPHSISPRGSPLIEGGIAYFDCTLESAVNAGDHVLFLGRLWGVSDRIAEPLLFVDSRLRPLTDVPPWEDEGADLTWPWL